VIKIKPALFAGIPFALALILSCSSNNKESDPDDKGNNIDNYKIANIGGLKWLAENLDYDVEGSKCYDNDPANCAIYGRLYNWVTAMDLPPECDSIECSSRIQPKHRGICPSGWHIPSNADWDKLLHYADSTKEMIGVYESPTAGKYLKSTSGWNNGGNGTDKFGFSALPGGYSGPEGTSFYHIGDGGYWWSASEEGSGYASRRRMRYNSDGVGLRDLGKSSLLSVRCLPD
jgi:uncharacterized protein (TIGR02145 family)